MVSANLPVALVALVLLCSAPLPAEESIAYFSVSLVNSKTRHLTPIIECYNGKLTRQRRIPIPHGSTFFVEVRAPRGRFMNAVFRDDTNQQFDLPKSARKITQDLQQFYWTMPHRFAPGDVDFYLCLWAKYNPETDTNDDVISRSGWITLGNTSL